MSIKNNLRTTVMNIIGAATELTVVSSEVLMDGSSLVAGSAGQIMPTLKALAVSPLSAHEGWLMERGMERSEAHSRAFALLDEDPANAVRRGAEAVGGGLASLSAGWDDAAK